VSDAVTTARNARESLARGLAALQNDPNVPKQILELAAPIAQAMGALHQIERSQGTQLQPHAETALSNVRSALAQLQAQPPSHPAIMAAMEAVAGSLSLVHSLAKTPQPAAPAPPAAVQQPAFPAPAGPPPAPAPAPARAATQQQPPYIPPQQAYAPPQQAYAQTAVAPPPAFVQSAARPGTQPVYQQPPPQQAPPARAPSASRPDLPVVPADLGAHSPTNFYKGLAGNDIIDHGGLFVQTYKIPKIGTPVRLKVSLPGGYEFEANAVVRWCREQSDAGNDAPPGFGAQFTDITPEARQLVYRYVRNREPLFHDDL
jgi:uncharacterized protein (TIGR02266 family)